MFEKDCSHAIGKLYNGFNTYLQEVREKKKVFEDALAVRSKGKHTTPTVQAVVILFNSKVKEYENAINQAELSMKSIERVLTGSDAVAEIFMKKYVSLITELFETNPDDYSTCYILSKQIYEAEDRLAESGFPIINGYKIYETYGNQEEETAE